MRRPQVLLLGNGISRAFSKNAVSWDEVLANITINEQILPKQKLSLPFGLQAVLRTDDQVDRKMNDISGYFDREINEAKYIEFLRKLIAIGFDDILTTNYDFDLEMVALGVNSVSAGLYKNITNHTQAVKRAEARYFLHTYQSIPVPASNKKCRIWHIHGHAKNPQSMVLGHYYYGNLLYKYKDDLENWNVWRAKRYINNEIPHSWLDAFIVGDVYILGLGLDFSELDLWWLINRKKREKDESRGNTLFYEPITTNQFNEKIALLSSYKVDVDHDLGISIQRGRNKNERYRTFYNEAFQDIKKRVELNRACGFLDDILSITKG